VRIPCSAKTAATTCCPRANWDVHRVGGREREGVSGARRREGRVRPAGRAPRFPSHVPVERRRGRRDVRKRGVQERERDGMTEGKPKRSYWRRGPRKKKSASGAPGTAAATPQVAEGGIRRRKRVARSTGNGGTGGADARPGGRGGGIRRRSRRSRGGGGGKHPRGDGDRERVDRRGPRKGTATAAAAWKEEAGRRPRPGVGGGIPPFRRRGVGWTGVGRRGILPGPGGRTRVVR